MLFPPKENARSRGKILRDLERGKIDALAAADRLSEHGEDPAACLFRGEARKEAGDLDGAEWWFWKGLDLQPAQFIFYLSVAEVRRRRDPKDRLAQRLVELALVRLGDVDEIPDPVIENFEKSTGDLRLDYSDPETYEMMATLSEITRGKEYPNEEGHDDPEVRARLLPYILLGDLQHQAPHVVDSGVIRQIQDNAGRCAPLFWAALRDWANFPHLIDIDAVAMFTAILGEIGGVEVLPDLLDLAFSSEFEMFAHSHWAIFRLGDRLPSEVLAAFGERAVDAPVAMRCVIAEHLAMMPPEIDVIPVAEALLDGFPGFANKEDGPYLLLIVIFAIGGRDQKRSAKLLDRYGDLLSAKNRKWILAEVGAEEGFLPRLMAQGIDEMDIDEICVGRALLPESEEEDEEDEEDEDDEEDDEDDQDDEDEEDDDEDEDEEDDDEDDIGDWEPVVAPPKPGRNDACWCGSGKKYKKCHLAADEEKERADADAPPQRDRLETPNQRYLRLREELFHSAYQWYGKAEMQRALQIYFGSAGQASELPDESNNLFVQWYLHDYRPKNTNRTAIEEYLRREARRLSAADRAVVESMRDSRYGLYEVHRVDPGRGLDVRDVFGDQRFFIHDATASRELVQWDCLLTRVEHFEDRYHMSGNGEIVPRLLLQRLKEFVETGSRQARQKPADFVAQNALPLHRQLGDLAEALPEGITITDSTGEPLEFSTATYAIVGERPLVLEGLDAIEGVRRGTSGADETALDRYDWVEAGVEGPVKAFGQIEVSSRRLVLSCSSRRRLELGREMLEKALGPKLLRHQEDHFETLEEARRREARSGQPKEPLQRLDPELERQIVLKAKAVHYAKWVDETIPALGGETPRQAVQTEAGRKRVIDLIRGIENLEARARRQGRPAFDTAGLRRTLGLPEE